MFGIIILAVYAVLMIGVTLMFTRKTTDAEGFHVADRRIGSAIAAMSIAATWIWAPSLFTSSEMAYTRGIPGMFWFTVPNVPVSYTHLDVYKRQAGGRGGYAGRGWPRG